MPQMFDWIFFAIVLPFPAFLVWDWYRNRAVPVSRTGSPLAGGKAGPEA